jgi:hypothetical protein
MRGVKEEGGGARSEAMVLYGQLLLCDLLCTSQLLQARTLSSSLRSSPLRIPQQLASFVAKKRFEYPTALTSS